jgi:hypothetical protein
MGTDPAVPYSLSPCLSHTAAGFLPEKNFR